MTTSSKRQLTKPKIVKPRLKWVLPRSGKAWVPYHRVAWVNATGKRRERAIALDWKGDPRRLDDLYWAAEAGRHPAQKTQPKHTWGECIREWRADAKVQKKLSVGTKKSYNREFEKILDKNAEKKMSATTRAALRKKHISMSHVPRAADWMLQAVSILWNYAKHELDWPIGDNPVTKMTKYGAQRAFPTWPDWMLSALDDAPDPVRIAGELIRGTGQRPSAAVSMKRSAFQGEWVVVTDEKGDNTFPIYCPERLRGLVNSLPSDCRHVLPKSETQPLSYNAVEKAFSAWRKSLTDLAEIHDDDPKRYSLHGLRKRACVELAEAGCSDAEIQSVTGQSLETVAQYRKEANRRAMSRTAQQRRAE